MKKLYLLTEIVSLLLFLPENMGKFNQFHFYNYNDTDSRGPNPASIAFNNCRMTESVPAEIKIEGADEYLIPFKGGCESLERHIRNTGTCGGGDCRKNTFAFTTLELKINLSFDYHQKNVNLLKCSCSGKIYEEEDSKKCLKECKVGLGCFAGICEPIGFKIKLTATPGMIKAGLVPQISVFRTDWRPGNPSSKCKKALVQFNQKIRDHESNHVEDARELVKKGIKAKNTHYGVGLTLKEAEDMLRNSILKELDRQVQEMLNEFEKMSHSFHDSQQGKNLDVRKLLCEQCN